MDSVKKEILKVLAAVHALSDCCLVIMLTTHTYMYTLVHRPQNSSELRGMVMVRALTG